MKISAMIAPPEVDFGLTFFKDKFENTFKKASDYGYDAIELAIKNPKEYSISDIKNLLNKNNLEMSGISTGLSCQDGLSFTSPDKNVRKKTIERIKEYIEFASNFKAKIIIGWIGEKIPSGYIYSEVEPWVVECLQECTEHAKKNDVIIVVEIINRYEVDFCNKVNDVIDLIKKVDPDSKHIGLLADIFHMNIEELDIRESLYNAKDLLYHVHFADNNRWPPGYGNIDFKSIIRVLKKIKYNDYITIEAIPFPNPETAAKNGIRYLKSCLEVAILE